MVFYFTGTGNSLYVAKQIEDAPHQHSTGHSP